MHNLKLFIKNEMEKDKSLATKLAKIAGFKNATPLYKFVNEPDREMDSLVSLLNIVEFIFENNTEEVLNNYFSVINPNGKFARQALEYSSFNTLSVKNDLITKMLKSSNKESREWASLYELFLTLRINPLKSLRRLNIIKTNYDETISFKIIMQMYCYYYLDNIHMVEILSHTLAHEIENIKIDYIKANYKIRLYMVMSVLYLDKNKIPECREVVNEILNICTRPYTFASVYQTLGTSYLYDDFDKGEKFLQLALKYYKMTPDKHDGEIHSALNLHRFIWGETIFELRLGGNSSDKHDAIMYFVQNKNNEKASEILSQINETSLSNRDLAFHNYCKGLIHGKSKYYYKSIRYFKDIGDKFYMRLPLLQLKDKGENENLLELISY